MACATGARTTSAARRPEPEPRGDLRGYPGMTRPGFGRGAVVWAHPRACSGGGKLHARADPHRSRPELLLLGAGDHVELGSTIRSAAAFGWNRALVEDRAGVWFGQRIEITEELARGVLML